MSEAKPAKFKAAIVGDQHLADRPPRSRTDNYVQAILSKLRFILQYCRDKNIPNVFLLGDMFHHKQPQYTTHWLVQTVISLFKEFQPSVTVWTLVGNHDFFTNMEEGLERQPLATVLSSGAVHPIGLSGYPEMFPCEGFNVEVNGRGYSDGPGGTEEDPRGYKLMYVDDASFKVALYHSTLLPDGEKFFDKWVNFEKAAPFIDAQFVACGHYHPGYNPPVQEAHGKTWTNPGAISRGTAEDHNLTRQIQFVTFSYDGKELKTKVVPVPHAPGPSVFNVEELERRKEENSRHGQFVESLAVGVAAEVDVSTVDSLCRMVGEMVKDPEVATLTKGFLKRAGEQLEAET